MSLNIQELIERLEEAAAENPEFSVAAAFEPMDKNEESIQVASVDLQNVLLCEQSGFVILHFVPIPIVKESLEIAEAIQEVIDTEGVEILGEDEPEFGDPDDEGLAP
jgi:hypothetical protein